MRGGSLACLLFTALICPGIKIQRKLYPVLQFFLCIQYANAYKNGAFHYPPCKVHSGYAVFLKNSFCLYLSSPCCLLCEAISSKPGAWNAWLQVPPGCLHVYSLLKLPMCHNTPEGSCRKHSLPQLSCRIGTSRTPGNFAGRFRLCRCA